MFIYLLDIDECIDHPCPQICHNLQPSENDDPKGYECQCAESFTDYSKDQDGSLCGISGKYLGTIVFHKQYGWIYWNILRIIVFNFWCILQLVLNWKQHWTIEVYCNKHEWLMYLQF